MSFAVISVVIGLAISAAGVSVAIANLDPEKRAWLWGKWKTGLNWAFYFVLVVNSALGIVLFGVSSAEITRASVLGLLLHFFNICWGFGLLFVAAVEKAMEARNAKRKELEEKVRGLESRLAQTGAPLPKIEVAATGVM